MKLGATTSEVLGAAGAVGELPPRLRTRSVAPAAMPAMPTTRPTLATVSCVLPLEMSLDLSGGQALPGHALWRLWYVDFSMAPKMPKTANPATPTPPATYE